MAKNKVKILRLIIKDIQLCALLFCFLVFRDKTEAPFMHQ